MRKRSFPGGIHPPGQKELTSRSRIVSAVAPEKVYIPLNQHIGAPCQPIVQAGDFVKLGQKIGEGNGFVSVPVHASVSGKVIGFEELPGWGNCVVIENDGKDEWTPEVIHNDFPGSMSPDQMRKAVMEAGVVGMGGAAFPAHVKFTPPANKPIEYLILNGSECEPYLTADHRIMVEESDRVIAGMGYIMKMLGCSKGFIGIEDNKPDAIKALEDVPGRSKKIRIVPLETKYPQGSEKHLIYTCTGREVPSGGLPLDVGAVVSNVSTAVAVVNAVEEGMPLIERVVTITGSGIKKPANYRVRIGTLVSSLVEQSGGYKGKIEKIVCGGPMMGRTLFSDAVPVAKGTTGILFLMGKEISRDTPRSCVRCGKCIDACPMFLEPTLLFKNAEKENWELVEGNNVLDCIECGSCSYVCPAKIPLVQYIRQGKEIVRGRQQAAAAQELV